jgi:hypothetical protein
MSFFHLQPFGSKFQAFEILIWFVFSSSSPNEHILALNKTCFSYTKSLKSICMIFYIPFDYSKNDVLKH